MDCKDIKPPIKLFMGLIIAIAFSIIVASPSYAFFWMIYHKPEFKGKVIDTETKEPIEGAVVAAVYREHPIISGPGGGSSDVINVKETLTDKNGEFRIPSYTTIISPNATAYSTTFIIFKPGYVSVAGLNLEDCFSGGTCKEAELPWLYNQQVKYKVAAGIVELPKLKTWKERSDANAISPTFYEKEWPLLHEMIKKEDEWLKKNKGWGR